jgi:hypothetical protein
MAIQGTASPEEDLILTQFAQARKKLGQQRKLGQDQLQDTLARQQAVTGLQGGTAAKVAAKGQKQLEEAFQGTEADLAGQEAQVRQGERQFQQQFGLQKSQFEESKRQFEQQMGFQWKEFDENKRTNFINALTALEKAGLKDKKLGEYRNATRSIYQ